MATVYVASIGHGALRRLAAVKLLRSGAPDHDYRTRFIDEARVVVRLHHNNIVDVREAGEVDGQLVIAMELIEGRDLADVWDRCAEIGRAFPVALAVHIVREALRGLHYAHTFPGLALVHRDVSPSNILIDWAGAVRLADFGLATSAMRAAKTVPGMVFGKVGYMAPEQATKSPLDPRADVYSCGVVLWELLTGRPLREAGTDTQAVAGWNAVPPSQRSSRVDAQLDAIVVRALQRDPAARYQSAQGFLEALSGWVAAHAPDTTQETLAAFMADMFGDARRRDHAAYSELLDRATSGAAPSAESSEPLPAAKPRPSGSGEHIAAGTIVAERYRVQQPLGQGGMGTVYLAEHVTVGRKVAIKVLTREWSVHPTVTRRFKEEARAASAAGHQNIVEVFDAGELPDGRLYLVMELLSGRSLYEELQETGPFAPARACRILRQVARAVRAAHGVGIIHRDLKPDNIMLVDRGEGEVVKVLDFGISASADRTEDEARLTMPGHALGTPEYMAPEQAKGHPPTPAFDIYAMGVILYEVLSGEPPFVSKNIVEVLTRKTTETPPPLDLRRSGLPEALVQLVHACLEADPAKRPATVDAFLAMLDPILALLEGADVVRSGPVHGFSGPTTHDSQRLPPPPAFAALDPALASVESAPSEVALLVAPIELEATSSARPSATLVPTSDLSTPDPPRPWVWFLLAGVAALSMVGLVWWAIAPEPDARASTLPTEATPTAGAAPAPPESPAASTRTDAPDRGGDPVAPEVTPTSPPQKIDEPVAPPEPAPPEPQPVDDAPPVDDDDGKPKADVTETPKCQKARATTKLAFDRHDWSGTLRAYASKDCWKGKYKADGTWMRTKALFETKQFDQCARAGRSGSGQARALAESCAQRVALEGG